MAIDSYGALQAAISTWLVRPELTEFELSIFTQLAEAEIAGDAFVQAMESTEAGTLTGETLAHPAGLIEARRLTVGDKLYYYRTPEVFYANSQAGNVARIFTSIGQTFHILGGASGDAYTLVYRATLPALETAGANWLLQRAPDAYLWACCKQGAVYYQDDMAAARFNGMYRAAMARVTSSEKMAAVSGSALQMAPAVRE